jgi:Fic/DOC family
MLSMAQIRFCAVECNYQETGPLSVANMCEALEFAYDYPTISPITLDFVRKLGVLVEPVKNEFGFRLMPVYFRNDPTRQALDARLIHNALTQLVVYGQELSAEEGYREFQKIHPFNDGNGRVGAILYNIWRGTIATPVLPPRTYFERR